MKFNEENNINLNDVRLGSEDLSLIINELQGTKAKTYRCRVIQSGAVGYPESNEIHYVTEEALIRMADSFRGRPVVVGHDLDITKENMKDKAKGYVTSCEKGYDDWYWVDFIVFDEDTINKIDNEGYGYVSCAYWRSDVEKDIVINDVKYNKVINNGFYLHLAITQNPRYNGTNISSNEQSNDNIGLFETVSFNEKGETVMFGFKKEKVSINEDLLFETVDGLKSVKDLVDFYNEKVKTEKNEEEKSSESSETEPKKSENEDEKGSKEEKKDTKDKKNDEDEDKDDESENEDEESDKEDASKNSKPSLEKIDSSKGALNENLSEGQFINPSVNTKVSASGPMSVEDRLALGKKLL